MKTPPHTGRGAFLAVIGLIIALGTTFTILNRNLPIVRNAALYAKISYNILDHRFDLLEIGRDNTLGYGKPLLFSAIAAPLVSVAGGNTGLVLASYFSTLFLLFSTVLFFRHFNEILGIRQNALAVQVLVTCFNPLFLYQFWSAYPDALFSAFFLLVFCVLDRSTRQPITWREAVLYFVFLFLCIATKYYGLVCLMIHPAYLVARIWMGAKIEFASKSARTAFALSALGFFLLMIGARIGYNPLLNLASDTGGGYQVYVEGVRHFSIPVKRNLICSVFFLLVTFHVSILSLVTRKAVTVLSFPLWTALAVYVGGLLLYAHMYWNIRFLLPVAPIISLLIAYVWQQRSPRLRVTMMTLLVLINIPLIAFFNSQTVFRGLGREWDTFAELKIRERGEPMGRYLDSFRMAENIWWESTLAELDAHVPDSETLYMLRLRYYDDGLHGLYERMGFLRDSLDIEYIDSSEELPITSRPVYLCVWGWDDEKPLADYLDDHEGELLVTRPRPPHVQRDGLATSLYVVRTDFTTRPANTPSVPNSESR